MLNAIRNLLQQLLLCSHVDNDNAGERTSPSPLSVLSFVKLMSTGNKAFYILNAMQL